ncbi:Vacuolar Protein [Balamuthia mandrillaris]
MEHLTPYELYSQILEIRGDKLVELSYENYDRLDPSWPGFDSWLRVRLHSIQIVLLRRFWGEFSNYFTEIKGIKSLVTATAKKMAEVASETADMINQRYVLRYEVEVANPTMFVPRSPTSQEAAILDLGHIFIANSYTRSKPSDAAPAKGNISREETVDFVNLDEADGTVPETEQPPHSEPSVSSATVGAQPEEQQGSLVEQINISATAINMQSCRGRLQDLMSHLRGPNAKSYADPVDTEHILKNADLNLVITRASKDADPFTPQMKIDAYVREVATCMTQAQLYTLIAIYRENYKLGFVPDPEPSSEHSEQAPSAGSSPSPQTSFRISYQISVVLNRLSIELLRDSPISSTNRWTDDVDGGLAGGTSPKATHSTSFNKSVYNPLSPGYYSIMRIDMNKPRIFILMGLDESMTVDFSLESINIVDTRPTPNYYKYLLCSANKRNAKDQTDKGRPTRVAKEDCYKSSAEGVSPEDEEDIASDKEKEKEKEKEKQASDSEEGASANVRSEDDDVTSIEQSQLLVYYRRDAKGAQALSITGHSPRLILLPDAVYSINQTLMPCVWALININTGLELMMATGEEATPPAPPPPTRLDMAVRLTSPLEIWIVENAFRKKTSCMVIQTDFTLRYVNDPLAAELGLTVVLESLAVSKADYIPEGKLKPSAIILPRVNAVYRYKRLGDTLQAQVHLDPVHITFSYKDFALLLRVLQELNPPPEKNQPSPSVDPASAESHKAAYETPPPTFVLDPPQKQRAKCKVGPLRLTFINDCGEVIPLADFRIYDVAFVVSSLSPKVSAAINFSVKGLYYNVALAKWEPIIEQWECSIRIKDTSKIRVMPEKRLDFNLTKSFFDTMKRNVELWQKDFYQIPMKDTAHASSVLLAKAKQKTFSPLYLCNDTGQKLLWWLPLRAAETPQDATELYPLEPSAVIPITSDLLRQQEQQQRQKGTTGEEGLVSATASVSMILSSSGNITTAKHGQGPPLLPSLYQMQRTIAFHLPSIPDAHPATNLPLHKVGTYLIPLMWPRDRPDQIYAIYEVTLADGSKVLNLRSNVLIRNETDHVLDIQVERHQRLQHDSLGPLAVKSSVSVPIHPAKTRAKFLRFRPHTDPEWNEQDQGPASCHILGEYNPTHYWTETPISCALPSTRCFALRSSPINADTALAAFYAVHVEARTEPGVQEGEGDHIVTVCPPLILENALVCDLAYSITNEKSGTRQGHLQRGESVAIYRFDTTEPLALSISVPGYKRNTPVYISGPNLKKKLALVPKNRTKFSHLDINIDNRITAKGTRKVSLYAQFWMINRTGLPLSYRQYPLPPKEKAQKSQKKWAKLIDRGGDPKDWGGGKFGEGELYKGLAAPVMFAYHQRDIVGNKVSIKIAGSHWSKPFSLENAGTVGLLEIKDKEHHTKGRTIGFQLSVQVDFAPPPFRRTKIITISPHVVLVNRMSSTIYYTQKGTNVKYTLEPNTRIPFHWPDGANRVKEGREMCIALPGYWHPSGEFDIEQLGQMVIKHRHHNGGIKLTGVEIRNEKGTNFVTFSDSFVPRYRVENCSPYEVTIYQKGVGIPQKLNMYESMAYCWDFPSKSHYLAIEVEEQFIRFVCLDKIKKYSDITVIKKEKLGFSPSNSIKLEEVSTPRHSGPIALVKHRTSKKFRRSEESNRQENGTEYLIIGAEITTDGPTRVLRILDRKTYPYFESLEASLKDTENEKSLKRRAANKAQSKITLKFKRGIGLSVVDGTPQELMYISMSDITLEYCNSSYYNVQYWDFKIKRFQIDNQLFFTPYPVVASPHMRLPADKSFLALSVIKSMEYREVDFYKYVALGVQELDVRIDETFLLKLLQFFNVGTDDISQAHFVDELLAKDDMICPLPSTTDTSRMLYFEFFHINPLQVNITLVTLTFHKDNPVRLAFGALGLGIKLPNIEGAPIRLNSLILRHPFTTQEELIERISAHYVRQAIIQAYKVLGSFDFLGNPVSFLNNLGTGVKDFFYEPFNAFVQSPKELGDGLAKGTSSLVKNSVYGVFNSVSKVTESMAKGISKLSFDQTYQVERDNSMRERPHDAGQGLIHGAKGFTKGLIGGLSGVVVEPIRGAQSGGAQGLVKGMAKGVVGVAVKPSVGVIETVSKTAQGIRNQADSWERDRTARQRLPRYFGQDKMLVPYVKEQALGQAILYGLSDRRYMNEWYMCHEYIDPPYLLLCSNTSIILVNCHQKFSQPQKEWRLKLSDLNREGRIETAVEIVEEAQGEEEVAGLRFWTQNVSTSSNLGKAAMPFAPISDAETRARAYTKLTKLVTEELLGDMKWVELFRYE